MADEITTGQQHYREADRLLALAETKLRPAEAHPLEVLALSQAHYLAAIARALGAIKYDIRQVGKALGVEPSAPRPIPASPAEAMRVVFAAGGGER